jgi:DNA anti-recombination protein RmuC
MKKGVTATKKLADEMTIGIRMVAKTSQNVYKDIKLIIERISTSIQQITSVTASSKEKKTNFKDFMNNRFPEFKRQVTRKISAPQKIVKSKAKKITDAVKEITASFNELLRSTNDGVVPLH